MPMPFRDVKANAATADAVRARGQRHAVFLYQFNIPGGTGLRSGPIPDAAEVIEAIESAGWTLDKMTFAETSRRNHGAVLLLFRPRQQ